jgi:SAM-dependent methyltransferase
MNTNDYDKVILDHYRDVALRDGDKPEATMADKRIRQLETEVIVKFFESAREELVSSGRPVESIVVADIGCGNGYTLDVLSQLDERPKFVGFEYSPELHDIAERRFKGKRVEIRPADIRNSKTISLPARFDIVICQRVIINVLDLRDQERARDNIISAASARAHFLFLECFKSGLDRLNLAREEFGMEPLPPAHHNLYLGDDFFDVSSLGPWSGPDGLIRKNFLSTHYFVTRVLHPFLLGGRPFQRNSIFASFMSQALAQNIGDVSPLCARVFAKAS